MGASRKRAKKIKHKKDMAAQGYDETHEAAAVKIQSIGRSKKDRKRVEAIRKQKEMEASLLALEGAQEEAAIKIQGAARKKKANKRAKKKRAAKARLAEMQAEGKEWSKEEK